MSCDATLKEKGLKLTPQRRLILDIIHGSTDHVTGEDIINVVQAKMPGVHKSTIYRTLEMLEKLGCVCKSESGDRFIYHHAQKGHHHHLICNQCGNTIECEEDLFTPVEKSLKAKYSFQAGFKHIVVKGICKKCLLINK